MAKEVKKKKKPKKISKVRRFAENTILVALVGIMLLSAFNIYKIVSGYMRDRKAYDSVSTLAGTMDFTGNVDFEELRNINPDIVGWLYYKDTKINYPIVQGQDNSKYLTTMFDGSYGGAGTLFVDYTTEKAFNQFNTIIYGHHMRDGSMFGDLKKLKEKDYCEKHPRFELITPKGKYHLEIWAFLNEPADSSLYETNFDGEAKSHEYIEKIKALAEYTTSVDVTTDDNLVVLSTCAYEYKDARYVVIGKMVPWTEAELQAAKLSDLKKNK
ncbi:MAG: class B sortase [Clostridiales bacterium]|nr:class B sortase [Clostridiales bacterium]